MIRPITPQDKAVYLQMARNFYQSDAVLSPIPSSYIELTFDTILSGTPFASAYLFEEQGVVCGYALLAHTWSQEAGGEVLWVEEIYVKPEYRGKGVGKEFFAFLENRYGKQIKRLRLEVEKENEGAVALYQSQGFSFFPYEQMKKDH